MNSPMPDDLAAMHAICLPTSFGARLGERYLRGMYRYVSRSRHEIIVSAFDGGALVGAAITTLSPGTMAWRLLSRTGVVWYAPKLMTWRKGSVLPRTPKPESAFSPPSTAPELLWLYVAATHRGRAFGSTLIADTEARLREKGIGRYYVRTFTTSNDPTTGFYERHGFVAAGMFRSRCEGFLCMVKQV